MSGLVCTGIVVFVVYVFIKLIAGGGSYEGLLKNGQQARGILISVNSLATSVRRGTFPLESRQVTIDVELPGQAPFVVKTKAIVPTSLRGAVLPGASVEVRIDKKNRNTLAIVGPGSGFAIFGPMVKKGTP